MSARRVTAVLFGLWFTLLTGEPEWLSGCPAHSRGGHARVGAVGETSDEAHATHHAPPTKDDAGHRCSCPGPSCGSGALLPSRRVSAALATVVILETAASRPLAEPAAQRDDYVLPFANGPPFLSARV